MAGTEKCVDGCLSLMSSQSRGQCEEKYWTAHLTKVGNVVLLELQLDQGIKSRSKLPERLGHEQLRPLRLHQPPMSAPFRQRDMEHVPGMLFSEAAEKEVGEATNGRNRERGETKKDIVWTVMSSSSSKSPPSSGSPPSSSSGSASFFPFAGRGGAAPPDFFFPIVPAVRHVGLYPFQLFFGPSQIHPLWHDGESRVLRGSRGRER